MMRRSRVRTLRYWIYDGFDLDWFLFVTFFSFIDKPREAITVTLPDGNTKEGISWETTPMSIALSIAKSLGDRIVIAKVNGNLWDLNRPLEESCSLELIDFENDEGKRVFWHSSAHVLGESCEKHYGGHLCIGPPLEDGFYYEMGLKDR